MSSLKYFYYHLQTYSFTFQACKESIQAMQFELPVIDNNVKPLYILLPNSELGKYEKQCPRYSTSLIFGEVLRRSANPVLRIATRLFLTAASKARNCPTITQRRLARVIAV